MNIKPSPHKYIHGPSFEKCLLQQYDIHYLSGLIQHTHDEIDKGILHILVAE